MPNANHYVMQKRDVIIVGAGPAGISTALHLANLAPELITRTLILEKARHPRPKLCGGVILPDAEMGKFFYGLRSARFQTFVWRQMGYARLLHRMDAEAGKKCVGAQSPKGDDVYCAATVVFV